MSSRKEQRRAKIVDQCFRQGIPFAQLPGHFDAMQVLTELSKLGRADSLLDVACTRVRSTCQAGYPDITQAMIEQAQKRQLDQNLGTFIWTDGNAVPLPCADIASVMLPGINQLNDQ